MSSLFVYGTLLSGQGKAGILGPRPRQAARVKGELFALPAGYPALVLRGSDWVHGELVQDIDDEMMRLLDHYEGVEQNLYQRVEVSLHLGLRVRTAWTYVMPNPERLGGRRLPKGRWHPSRRHRR